jgi:hypothetical protein
MLRNLIRILSLSVFCTLSACLPRKKSDYTNDEKIAAIDTTALANLTGKELSEIYCAICHKYPEPGLLDRKSWQYGDLPYMGRRLGIQTGFNPYDGATVEDIYVMLNANIYPDKPLLSNSSWKKIHDYYIQNSPEILPKPKYTEKADTTLLEFKAHPVKYSPSDGSMVTFVGYNPFNKLIYVGDYGKNLVMMDVKGTVIDSMKMPSLVTCVNFINKNLSLITCVGILMPNDQSKGRIYEFNNKSDTVLLLKNLKRPVYTEVKDLNNDKRSDLIVCEYGNQTGQLTWFENKGNRDYTQHILIKDPGSERTETYDFNNDGLPDIMALLAQGNERIMIFYNQGNGEFSSTTPLQFPPVNGSLYFELVDFNHDGFQDIIYSCGDNADKSMVLKPYHGIYIFQNDGKNEFSEKYFYPYNGCIKAIPYDFDGDSDIDIAAISFFPDFKKDTAEGFLYFENVSEESTNFKVSTFTANQNGRWLVMNRADYDNDGDQDLIMGSFLFSVSPVPSGKLRNMMKNNVNIFLLENQARPGSRH